MKDLMREELGAPKIVDRSTFQTELDALRVREKAHTRRPRSTSRNMGNEILWFSDCKVTNKERINQGENSGVCADSQCKRENSDDGEAGSPAQAADGVAQILPECPHASCSRSPGVQRRHQIYAERCDLASP